MITLVEVEKLCRVHAVEPIVLSVYLNVPRSAAGRSGLPAPVDELVISGPPAATSRDLWLCPAVALRQRRKAYARPGWLPVIRARETTDRLVQIF
jgi:hypothetical protein